MPSVKNPDFPVKLTLTVIFLLLLLLIFGQVFTDEGKILITALVSSGYFLYLSVKHRLLLPKKFIFLYSIFLFINALSLRSSPSLYNSLLRLIELSSFLFLIILSYNCCTSIQADQAKYNLFLKDGSQKIFSRFLIILASIISLVTIFHYQMQSRDSLPYQSTQWPFAWPGLLASFLFIALPFVFSGLIAEKNKFLTVIRFLAMILTIFALFLTKSSWTTINFLLLMLIIWLFFRREIKKKIPLFLGLAFVVFALIHPLVWQNNNVTPNLRTITFQTSFACYDSNDIRNAGKTMFFSHPILGNGPSSFEALYQVYQKEPWSKSKFAFNEYLQILVENGILGLLSFLFIIGYLFYLFFRKGEGEGRGDGTKIAFFGIFIFLFYNLSEFPFRFLALTVLFWILTGFYLAAKEEGRPAGKVIKLFSLALFLSTSFLIMGLSQFNLSQNYLNHDSPQKAKEILSRLTKIFPFNPNYLLLKSQAEDKIGNTEGAIEDLKKAQALETKNPDIIYQIGSLYKKMGKNNEAENYLKKTIELAPFSPPVYYNSLIQLYISQGETEKVNKLLTKATEEIFPLNDKFDLCLKYLVEEGTTSQLLTIYTLQEEFKNKK